MRSRADAIRLRDEFLIVGPRHNEPPHIEAAIIGNNPADPRAVRCAADLRRAGIPTVVFLSGNRKRQIQKAHDQLAEYLVLLEPDRILLRDCFTFEEQPVEIEQLAPAVLECLIYDWRIEDQEMFERRRAESG